MITHEFYCVRCGNRGIPIARNEAAQREKGHLKKLYCIHCKEEVNHYECRNEQDVKKFKMKFERGDFKNDSIENNVRGTGKR